MHNNITNLLAFLIFPVALIQKSFFAFMPDLSLHRLLFYYLSLLFIWLLCTQQKTILPKKQILWSWPILSFTIIILCLQNLAFTLNNKFSPSEIFENLGWLALQIGIVLIFTYSIRLLFNIKNTRQYFIYGAFASLLLLILTCFIQITWLLSQNNPQLTALHEISSYFLSWFGQNLETRSLVSHYDFYSKGSYVMTELRINGMFDEASNLASSLVFFYLPLLIGAFAVSNKLKYSKLINITLLCLLLSILLILASARSTTAVIGFIFILAYVGLVAIKKFKLRPKHILLLSLSVSLGLILILVLDEKARFFATRLFETRNHSLPRLAISLELFNSFLNYPVLGTGFNQAIDHISSGDFYLNSIEVRANSEMMAWKLKLLPLPILCLLFHLLAEFGLFIVCILIISLLIMNLKLRKLCRTYNTIELHFATNACNAYLAALALLSFTSLDWHNPLLLLPFIAFWSIIKIYNEK